MSQSSIEWWPLTLHLYKQEEHVNKLEPNTISILLNSKWEGRWTFFVFPTTWFHVFLRSAKAKKSAQTAKVRRGHSIPKMDTPHKFDREKKAAFFFARSDYGSMDPIQMDMNVQGCRWVIFECVAKLGARKTFFFFAKGSWGPRKFGDKIYVVIWSDYINRVVEYDALYDTLYDMGIYCMF